MTDTINAKLADTKGIRLENSHKHYKGSRVSKHSLPLLIVDNKFCDAVISLQGAQLLSFQPKGKLPWLWLSPYTDFEPDQPIRGGIPICLPWFGANQQDHHKPKHGFVRNHLWQLQQVSGTDDSTQITLLYHYAADKPELFTTAFDAQLIIQLSGKLELNLSIINQGKQAADFSWAFHSYFATNDLANTSVNGLDQQNYLDNTQNLSMHLQTGSVEFSQEVDRVYQTISTPQQISAQQQLTIEGNNCPSCIIWNPGENMAQGMSDIKEYYKDFICVERGCAFNDTIRLDAGESFSGTMIISQNNDSFT